MKLVLVPTPIGNLKDITFRAIEELKSADYILAEDTRTSAVLLNHYSISTPLRSYHQHNEHKILEHLIQDLQTGKKVALISDAGTPGISDPGFLLVRECWKNGIPVECLPGATAFTPAIVASGFPCNNFIYEGFLPQKKGRKTLFENLAKEERTICFYESPHRLAKTLKEMVTYFGEEREVCVCRELSKKFEEYKRGSLISISQHYETHQIKGEVVVVVKGLE